MNTTNKNLLIVEDNTDLCDIYKIAFEAVGYEVRLSLNGMDGIVKSLEKKPDVILLDLMMPDMDGFEVLQALRQNSSLDVVIIINSNLSQEKDIDRAMRLGATAYLQKSNYSPYELFQQVEKIIAEKQGPASSASTQVEKLKENILSMFFSQDFLNIFNVLQVRNDEAENTVILEEKMIPPVWNGKSSSIGGFLPPETITGLSLGEKPLSLVVQRHIWQVEGESTTIKYDIAIRNNAIILSIKEIVY